MLSGKEKNKRAIPEWTITLKTFGLYNLFLMFILGDLAIPTDGHFKWRIEGIWDSMDARR